jgi:4-hydroxybenzoate polyprenyltransferase
MNPQLQNIKEVASQVIKVARPIHWIKNIALFAALVFSGNLFSATLLRKVLLAFVSFSLASSATYTFNDLKDAEFDRLHPTKRNRPIASGKLSPTVAAIALIVFGTTSLLIANQLNNLFLFATAGYLLLQVAYSSGLKNIPIVDILIIAAGFIIRVYAGAFVIDAHLSVWFLLCVISVALFLASGKRRAELGFIMSSSSKKNTRKSLTKYSTALLDSYVAMFGNAAWLSWALFTFFESPSASIPVWIFLAEISRTTTISKLLMFTIPVAIFGIMRYQALIFENRSEAPERLLLTDKSLVVSIVLWVALVIWIFYGGVTGIN